MEEVMLALMGRPFHFKKKARKRRRRFAKKAVFAAGRLETESINRTNSAATLRRLAESNLKLAKLHKKKKSKNPR
jgi:hypothetical protein